MANRSRAQIDAALFFQIKNGYTWQLSSMHFRPWEGQGKVDASDQPAFFLRRIIEETQQTKGYGLNRYILKYECWVYTRVDNLNLESNPYSVPNGPGLDQLIDAIDAALAPNPVVGMNQLGGIVDNCRIEGQIIIADGTDNGQAVIRIPISVYTGI